MKNLTEKMSLAIATTIVLMSCGSDETKSTAQNVNTTTPTTQTIDPTTDKGVGPITSISLESSIDADMAKAGEELFNSKCSACHKMDERKIGPALAEVTKRRTPEWIMNMIMNPDKMVQENAQAKQLLMEYSAPMANQSLTESETRTILEYFRQYDNNELLTQK